MISESHTATTRASINAEGQAALRCTNLVKQYADVRAVNDLNLEVRRGECFGLLGPNGAGKTTTVEILEGLTKPDGGTVEVLGQHWGAGGDLALRTRIGVQLQETQLAEKLTVEETVQLFRSFYKTGRDPADVIRIVEMEEKRTSRVGKLSGGQKQRLAIACTLVGDPELIFLDEPTTGLDPQARLKLWEIVEEFKRGGGTVLLTTHYMEEAARLCDRLAIMDHGQVIALGTPRELIERLGADQMIEFTVRGAIDERRLGGLPGVRNVHTMSAKESDATDERGMSPSSTERTHALAVSDIGAALPSLLAEIEAQGAELVTLVTHQATLEDVFVSLTGRMLRDA